MLFKGHWLLFLKNNWAVLENAFNLEVTEVRPMVHFPFFVLLSNLKLIHSMIESHSSDGKFSCTLFRQVKSGLVVSVACQFLPGISSCSSSVIIPVTSGCFSSSRSPYFRVELVVSVPAENTSHMVVIRLSMVNADCLLCFSWQWHVRRAW